MKAVLSFILIGLTAAAPVDQVQQVQFPTGFPTGTEGGFPFPTGGFPTGSGFPFPTSGFPPASGHPFPTGSPTGLAIPTPPTGV
ncbi:uncharacterized protein BCR38DRAFT_482301 [Pseudomassariella vexata]|uniref:Uncharacterized protein n=1 Tax=Pseudomassariella vexata TaxID=1141098 RepID=A0A1Y2EC38_9PEZI|nr:uncharacterized protein BCR38DRAFT_482301 [Pseudomassariella vexata]ORY68826.1 hypothetical protein BCR38DRAFT_482301 [Pseudomassariella vexata]